MFRYEFQKAAIPPSLGGTSKTYAFEFTKRAIREENTFFPILDENINLVNENFAVYIPSINETYYLWYRWFAKSNRGQGEYRVGVDSVRSGRGGYPRLIETLGLNPGDVLIFRGDFGSIEPLPTLTVEKKNTEEVVSELPGSLELASVGELSHQMRQFLSSVEINTLEDLVSLSEEEAKQVFDSQIGLFSEVSDWLAEKGQSFSESILIDANEYWEDELSALADPIEYLRLSTRPSKCLARAQIKTISELLTYSENDLINMQNFGQGSLDEIIDRLDDFNLYLDDEESQAIWAATLSGSTYEPPKEPLIIPEVVLNWAHFLGFETIADILTPTGELAKASSDVTEALENFLSKPVPAAEDIDLEDLIVSFVEPETRDGDLFMRRIVKPTLSYRALGEEYGVTAEAMRRNADRLSQQKSELFRTDEYRLLRYICTYLVSLITPFVYGPDLKERFLAMGVHCECGKYTGPQFSGICCEQCYEYVELRYGDAPSASKSLEEVLTKFDLPHKSEQGLAYREVIWWGMEEICGFSGSLEVEEGTGLVIVDSYAISTARDLLSPYIEDAVVDEDNLRNQFKEAHLPSCPIQDEVSAVLIAHDFRRIDGKYCYLAGNVADKAVSILKLKKVPLTSAEITELIGEGHKAANLQNRFPNDHRFMRTDRHQRYALRDWGMEEYSGIYQEICERIERGDGVASVEGIIEEFVRDFGVTENSVRINLENAVFSVSGDHVRFSQKTEFEAVNPSLIPNTVQTPEGWGQRFTVSEDNFNGYSFNVSNHVAYANGIRPDQSLRVPVNTEPEWDGESSIIWRSRNTLSTTDIGRLRKLLERDFQIGDGIIIVPNPTEVSVFRIDEFDDEEIAPDNEEERFSVRIRD